MDTPNSKPDHSTHEANRSLIPSLNPNRKERVFDILKIGLQAVQPIGPMLASAIESYGPNVTRRSVREFSEYFAERIRVLQEACSDERFQERLASDDFIESFNRCLWISTMTSRKSKIRAAASLASEMLKPDSDKQRLTFGETDFLIRCVDGLSTEAIDLLIEATSKSRGKRRDHMSLNFDSLATHITDADLKLGLLNELSRFNLVQVSPASITVESKPYSNYGIRLTLMGKKFADRILTEPESLAEDL